MIQYNVKYSDGGICRTSIVTVEYGVDNCDYIESFRAL
jgi:hypothetical protein